MTPAEIASIDYIQSKIDEVPDFPKPGILFRDITPLLADYKAFRESIEHIALKLHDAGLDNPDYVTGAESRGFIFGTALALRLSCGFIPLRKPGKLPKEAHQVTYDLEYGHNSINLQKDAMPPGSKVLFVDDLLATGGTAEAGVMLAKKAQCEVLAAVFLIELKGLTGRELLQGTKVISLLEY